MENPRKLITLGLGGVGKTSLLERFTEDKFTTIHKSTVGCEFSSKKVEHDGKHITIQIWDTVGQERYNSLAPVYIRNADVVIFMFDLTDTKTLDAIFEIWISIVKRSGVKDNCIYYLVGTKYDEYRKNYWKINMDKYKTDLELKYYKTSAKIRYNTQELLDDIVEKLAEQVEKIGDVLIEPILSMNCKDEKNKSKCKC